MKSAASRLAVLTLFGLCLSPLVVPAADNLTGFPFTNEALNYTINWPNGTGLGTAHLNAKQAGGNWNFEFSVDAGIPGFRVKDTYRAEAPMDLCTSSFSRDSAHGTRLVEERETVDKGRQVAVRMPNTGGQTEMAVPACVKDALTYLFYSRQELGQGRVPAAQPVLFGGLYSISFVYAGAPMVPIAGKQEQSDQVTCTVKGPSSSFSFEMYFARDAARTPLLVKVPLAVGTFSMEFVR